MELSWLWTVVAMAVAGGASYLISRYGVSGKIGEYVNLFDGVQKDVTAFATVLLGALKPDADGTVRVTPDEVNDIKLALSQILSRFGIELPF